jgi:TonB family protein
LSFNDVELGSVSKIWNISLKGEQLSCVDSRVDEENQTACFDSLTGVLVLTRQMQFADLKRQVTAENDCEYSNYQKFGEKIYPIKVVCLADGKVSRQMTMTEMIEDHTPPDSNLFSIPADGREWPVCSKLIPPHLTSAPDIGYPRNGSDKTEKTKIQLIVGIDGKPTDMKLVKPGGNPFDYEALKAVGQWKFKPASCGGISVPYQIMVFAEFGHD